MLNGINKYRAKNYHQSNKNNKNVNIVLLLKKHHHQLSIPIISEPLCSLSGQSWWVVTTKTTNKLLVIDHFTVVYRYIYIPVSGNIATQVMFIDFSSVGGTIVICTR